MNTPLLDQYPDHPPTCIHILGQSLVTALWKEGQEAKKTSKALRFCAEELLVTLHNACLDCPNIEQQIKAIRTNLNNICQLSPTSSPQPSQPTALAPTVVDQTQKE